MTEEEWNMTLEGDGFTDIKVVSIRPGDMTNEPHTHERETVHVILKGKLMVTDSAGVTTTYEKDDRVDFPAGTEHVTLTGPEGMKMMVGVKK